MKKIVILGSQGMAGHLIFNYLLSLKKYEVYGISKSYDSHFSKIVINVENEKLLTSSLKKINPDIVINCIGILVDASKKNIKRAIKINGFLPHFLSDLGNEIGFKLIHLSTDCVFSGIDGNYQENSSKDGKDWYAKTKSVGEVINNKDLTIRTSIIGPELKKNGSGLLNWFLSQNKKVYGFKNVFWSGVTTLELAKQMEGFIDQDIKGLFHLCPEEKISKYSLLSLINEKWNKKIIIEAETKKQIDKSLICTRDDFSYINHRPSYNQMIIDLKQWVYNNNIYQHLKDF